MEFINSFRRKCAGRKPVPWILAITAGICLGIWAGHLVLDQIRGSIAIVQGTSMMPTFKAGTCICTSRPDQPLKRGQVVLVDDGLGGCAIKRIVGLPRERVHLWRGYVFINGRMLREPYLPKYTFTSPVERKGKAAFALGVGSYFVMGDNRLCSYDSRYYGPVLKDQIISVVNRSPGPAPEFAPFALPVHGRQTIRRIDEDGQAVIGGL